MVILGRNSFLQNMMLILSYNYDLVEELNNHDNL